MDYYGIILIVNKLIRVISMTSEPLEQFETVDSFQGGKLLTNYVDSKEFYSLLSKYGVAENEIGTSSILELYYRIPRKIFNKVFLNCVMFNHLKNVYIYNISVKKEKFKSEITDVLKDINDESNVPVALKPYIVKEGFNLMTVLGNQSKLADKFVLALEYMESDEIDQARLLFSQVVLTKSGKVIHNVCGVIVDFTNNKCLISFKNNTDLDKGNDPDLIEKFKITMPSYRDWIIQRLKDVVGFEMQDTEEVRLQMYEICKAFDEVLLREDRLVVTDKLKLKITQDINEYLSLLTTENISVSENDKESLIKSTLSLVNGVYVKSKYQNKQLQKKAKALKLDGYPTKIQYTSSKLDKGATQSSGKNEPVSSSEIYHSIYNNFSEASSLDKWCIAWFTDYNHDDVNNYDVIQTTIQVKIQTIHITFLPKRALNEELISHVIRKISNRSSN